MEWLLIPSILAGIAGIATIIWFNLPNYGTGVDLSAFTAWTMAALCLIALFVCPLVYYNNQNLVLQAQSYYDTVIEPNIIEVGNGTVVVSGIGPAMWQAGSVVEYNSLLKTNRYWDSVPIIGTCVYRVPDALPFAEVQ